MMPRKKPIQKKYKKLDKTNLKKLRHKDVPATVGLVLQVSKELMSETRGIRHEVSSFREKMCGEIDSVRGEISSVRGEIGSLHHDMKAMESKMFSSVHGIRVLMEEQRAENKVVLDGLKNIIERQDRMEEESKEFRKTLQILVKTKDLTPEV